MPVTVIVYEPAANASTVSVSPFTSKASPSSEPVVTAAVYATVAPKKFEPSVTSWSGAAGLTNVNVLGSAVIVNGEVVSGLTVTLIVSVSVSVPLVPVTVTT